MAVSLGIQEPDELDVTLVNVLEKVVNDEDLIPGEGIIHHEMVSQTVQILWRAVIKR